MWRSKIASVLALGVLSGCASGDSSESLISKNTNVEETNVEETNTVSSVKIEIQGISSGLIDESNLYKFSASISDGSAQIKRWRVYLATNANPKWTEVNAANASTEINYSFSAPGAQTWIVEVEDSLGNTVKKQHAVLLSSQVVFSYEGPSEAAVAQINEYNFGVNIPGNTVFIKRWRVYLATNANPKWTELNDYHQMTSISYAFLSAGDQRWIIETEDSLNRIRSKSFDVKVQ